MFEERHDAVTRGDTVYSSPYVFFPLLLPSHGSHVSFVDCPGHDILMATMLNGAAIMDAALLLIGQ